MISWKNDFAILFYQTLLCCALLKKFRFAAHLSYPEIPDSFSLVPSWQERRDQVRTHYLERVCAIIFSRRKRQVLFLHPEKPLAT